MHQVGGKRVLYLFRLDPTDRSCNWVQGLETGLLSISRQLTQGREGQKEAIVHMQGHSESSSLECQLMGKGASLADILAFLIRNTQVA